MLRYLLARQGHEVHEAVDGPSGVEAILRVRPDIAWSTWDCRDSTVTGSPARVAARYGWWR
jgi:hypothetical protein